MIENFHIACKAVDNKLGDITGYLNTKYVTKCYHLFEFHQKFLVDMLQTPDLEEKSANKVKEHFE